jgi:hypothetical protein
MERVTVVSWESANGVGYEYFIDPLLAQKMYHVKRDDHMIDEVRMDMIDVSSLDSEVVKCQVEHELFVGGV